jgi:hypothetical protein
MLELPPPCAGSKPAKATCETAPRRRASRHQV